MNISINKIGNENLLVKYKNVELTIPIISINEAVSKDPSDNDVISCVMIMARSKTIDELCDEVQQV